MCKTSNTAAYTAKLFIILSQILTENGCGLCYEIVIYSPKNTATVYNLQQTSILFQCYK